MAFDPCRRRCRASLPTGRSTRHGKTQSSPADHRNRDGDPRAAPPSRWPHHRRTPWSRSAARSRRSRRTSRTNRRSRSTRHIRTSVVAGANDEIDDESCAAGAPNTCPFTDGRRRVRGVLLLHRRPVLDPADLHRLDRPRLPGPGALHAARRPDRHAARLLRGRPGGRRRPGADLRAAARRRRQLLLGERLAAVLRQPRLQLQRRALGCRRSAASRPSRSPAPTTWPRRRPATTRPGTARWWSPSSRATTFSDKEQIWADSAESSPFFGNVYTCWASFRSNSQGNALPTPLTVATSQRRRQHLAHPAGRSGHRQRQQHPTGRLHRAYRQPRHGLRLRHRHPQRAVDAADVPLLRRRRALRRPDRGR